MTTREKWWWSNYNDQDKTRAADRRLMYSLITSPTIAHTWQSSILSAFSSLPEMNTWTRNRPEIRNYWRSHCKLRAKHFQKYKLNRQKWAFVAYFPFHLTAHCNPGQSEVLDESLPLATQARQYTSQSKAKWKTDKFRQKDRIKSSKPLYSSDPFKGERDSEYTSMKIETPLFSDKSIQSTQVWK